LHFAGIFRSSLRRLQTTERSLIENDMELTGAEITVRFGYPGGAVLHIYDELFKQDTGQAHPGTPRAGRVHAADGYARATGKPGVVLVTSGPGATNAVTGIATAYMDSIPMVILTGQVPTHAIGQDAFQEVDSIGITRPCVKHNFLVEGRATTSRRRSRRPSTSPRPAARSGGGRHPEGHHGERGASTCTRPRSTALVQPGGEGPPRSDQEGGAAAARSRSAR
jgi:hypothetical protein